MICKSASVALSLLATPGLMAQIVVDPGGGGHYRDLQAAIDAVPPGTVIKVIGGTYGPLVIGKSLTIAGAPAPTIRSPADGSPPAQPPAIALAGNGSDRLVLQNVRVSGLTNGITYSEAGCAIQGRGFAALDVYDSVIHAHEWTWLTGLGLGRPAIELSGARVILLARSDVQASTTDHDSSFLGWLPNGAEAILARGATVIALASAIRGGGCGRSQFELAPPSTSPCPCGTTNAIGGPGVVADSLIDVGAIITGGLGSEVVWRPGFTGAFLPWGRQPNGPPFVVSTRTPIPLELFAATGPRLGQLWSVDVLFTVSLPGALIVGSLAPVPWRLTGGLVFIDPALPITAVPMAQRTLGIMIPSLPSLGGSEACLQFVSLGGSLTNPIALAVGF